MLDPIDYSQLDTATFCQLLLQSQHRIEGKLDGLAADSKREHERFLTLEAEHKARIGVGETCSPVVTNASKKQLAGSAAAGGGIVGLLIVIFEVVKTLLGS